MLAGQQGPAGICILSAIEAFALFNHRWPGWESRARLETWVRLSKVSVASLLLFLGEVLAEGWPMAFTPGAR